MRGIRKIRAALIGHLQQNGVSLDWAVSNKDLAEMSEIFLRRQPPKEGEPFSTVTGRLRLLSEAVKPDKQDRYSAENWRRVSEFYESPQWRRVRYDALKKNDGRCELCGRSKHDGIVLNVDHIKNIRDNWGLRLKQDNLQVLCNECNHGKGNRDDTDWRQNDIH